MENNTLFNSFSNDSAYFDKKEFYQNHLLEQYKIYLELTDRISARRNLASVFFSSLNTSFIAIIGFSFEKITLINPPYLIIFPVMGFIGLNIIWYILIGYYKSLNSARFKVIDMMEKKLVVTPHQEDWKILKGGKELRTHKSLSKIERIVPFVFIYLYIIVIIYVCFFVNK